MEPASAYSAKLLMLEGSIDTKDIITNKSSTYTVVSRPDEGEKKEVPTFPKGHGE